MPRCVQETVLYHLIKRGVEMTTKDNEGHTPMDVAKKNENEECVKLIQETLEPEKTLIEENGSTSLENVTCVAVEVHEPEIVCKGEESKDTVDNQQTKDEDTFEDISKDEEAVVTPPLKKKKTEKRIRFLLEDEEPVTAHEENAHETEATGDDRKESDGEPLKLVDDVSEETKIKESITLSSEIQTSEIPVSLIGHLMATHSHAALHSIHSSYNYICRCQRLRLIRVKKIQ